MLPHKWLQEVKVLNLLLEELSFTGKRNNIIQADTAFALWTDWTIELKNNSGTIYLIGNGASASMASHYSADLAKNAGLHTEVFSDLSLITAISNDIGYEYVFAEPLKRRGKKGDILIAISSSGESPNILRAVEEAAELKMKCVTLSAMSPDNSLRRTGDLNAYIRADSYGHAETGHAAVLHHWMDSICRRTARRNKVLDSDLAGSSPDI